MNEQQKNHFKQNDPILHALIQKLGDEANEIKLSPSTDYFSDLCEAIVNQQLSEKAGNTIHNRFLALLKHKPPTPEDISKISDESLRSVGMSWSKVRYIKSLAASILEKNILFETIHELDDESVICEITKLHGIGRWTAEMFLMFSLGRPDVFSYTDAGLRRAIFCAYEFKKTPTDFQVKKIVQPWSPYKTYACRILWKSLDSGLLQ